MRQSSQTIRDNKFAGRVERRRSIEPSSIPLLLVLFILSFIFPRTAGFFIADVFLTPQRIVLLTMAIACGLRLLSGFRFISADIFLLLFVSWAMFCFFLHYGFENIGLNVFIFITYFSCYFFAQMYIVKAEDVTKTASLFFMLAVVFGVLAIPEAVLKTRYIPDFFAQFTGIPDRGKYVERLGLLRAKTVFVHPINYGLFCASIISYIWYCARSNASGIFKVAMTFMCVFLALSSGPLLAAFVQIGLIFVERMTRWLPNRGTVVMITIAVLLVILEIASKGPLIQVLLSRFTLDSWTAYYRLLIFEHMSDDILRNPIFGFRIETWTRLHWMTSSVDNFWLMVTGRFGFPGLALLVVTLLLIIRRLFKAPADSIPPKLQQLRIAACFTLVGLSISGTTVHFFGKMEVLFAFQLGLAAAISRMVETASESKVSPEAETGTDSEKSRPRTRKRARSRVNS